MTHLSPLSPTKTFKNELFHTNSSHQILGRVLSPREQSNNHHIRQGFHIPYLRRCPSPGIQESRITITTVRLDTICARSAPSACVHTAILNISAMMDGENSHWLRSVFQTWSCFRSSHNLHRKPRHCCTRWLNALTRQQPTLPLRHHVETILVRIVL